MALTISLILTTLETFEQETFEQETFEQETFEQKTFEQKTFANFKALWLFTNVLVYEIWEA